MSAARLRRGIGTSVSTRALAQAPNSCRAVLSKWFMDDWVTPAHGLSSSAEAKDPVLQKAVMAVLTQEPSSGPSRKATEALSDALSEVLKGLVVTYVTVGSKKCEDHVANQR